MAYLSEPTTKLILSTLGLITLILLAGLLILLTLAAIFPDRFEAMGVTSFHNKQTGVFTDCFSEQGKDVPACENKIKKEMENRLKGIKPDPRSLKKPRIIPFTFD